MTRPKPQGRGSLPSRPGLLGAAPRASGVPASPLSGEGQGARAKTIPGPRLFPWLIILGALAALPLGAQGWEAEVVASGQGGRILWTRQGTEPLPPAPPSADAATIVATLETLAARILVRPAAPANTPPGPLGRPSPAAALEASPGAGPVVPEALPEAPPGSITINHRGGSIVITLAEPGGPLAISTVEWRQGRPPTRVWRGNAGGWTEEATHRYDNRGRLIRSTVVQDGVARERWFVYRGETLAELVEEVGGLRTRTLHDPRGLALSQERSRAGDLEGWRHWFTDSDGQGAFIDWDRKRATILLVRGSPGSGAESQASYRDPGAGFDPRTLQDPLQRQTWLAARRPFWVQESLWDDQGRLVSQDLREGGVTKSLRISWDPLGSTEDSLEAGVLVQRRRVEGDQTVTTFYRQGQSVLRVYQNRGARYKEEVLQGDRVIQTREWP